MENFIEYQNAKIHFKVEGKGPALVLVHGFLESLNMWDDMVKLLKNKFTIVRLDLPGHGRSDLVADITTMELGAKIIADLADTLMIESVVVVGHSMGGYIALSFANLYSHRTKGVLLFHSHAAADSAEGKINRGRAIKVVEENHKSFISTFIPDLFTSANREKFREKIELMQSESREMSKESIIAALAGMRQRPGHEKFLRSAEVPVGFIIGQKDSRAPIADLMEQVKMPSKSYILMLRDAAHMGFIEEFDTTSKFLEAFGNMSFSG